MSTMTRALQRVASPPGPACAEAPERMFPIHESERPGERTPGEARALQLCATCPVLVECRRAVLRLGGTAPLAYGVAGGMTREDRRAVRAASRRLSREASAGRPAAGDVPAPRQPSTTWEAA